MWGATTHRQTGSIANQISIHAPRVGSDRKTDWIPVTAWRDFNPRSPCGERPLFCLEAGHQALFQSTLPVWGATSWSVRPESGTGYFNPRSPCGERQLSEGVGRARGHFNPRSPCGERRLAFVLVGYSENFNPRSPCGERLAQMGVRVNVQFISIHAPRVGSDLHPGHHRRVPLISIHAPRVGSDKCFLVLWRPCGDFNPRSPCGERRAAHLHPAPISIISIHAPRVGSDGAHGLLGPLRVISIHAPRVGSDYHSSETITWGRWNFNPRSPCGERPQRVDPHILRQAISIHAPRVGSDLRSGPVAAEPGISIHAPRVGSDYPRGRSAAGSDISIHAPRVGSDTAGAISIAIAIISIHAPRVGSDEADILQCEGPIHFNPRSPCGERRGVNTLRALRRNHFNPRSPCGERPPSGCPFWASGIFQSTLPVWGATVVFRCNGTPKVFQSTLPVWGATGVRIAPDVSKAISIHAPRVGSDGLAVWDYSHLPGFQSTLPVWGATEALRMDQLAVLFQSTLPVWGATAPETQRRYSRPISIHAPRVGSDINPPPVRKQQKDFNPRSPCGERR